jgi:hypothetical protein
MTKHLLTFFLHYNHSTGTHPGLKNLFRYINNLRKTIVIVPSIYRRNKNKARIFISQSDNSQIVGSTASFRSGKSQTQFQDAWSTSAEDTSSKKELPWASDAANKLMGTLNSDLFKRIDIAADDDGEPYVTAIKMINEAIDEAHIVQRARISRNESDDVTPVDDVKANEKKQESVSKSEERETEMV